MKLNIRARSGKVSDAFNSTCGHRENVMDKESKTRKRISLIVLKIYAFIFLTSFAVEIIFLPPPSFYITFFIALPWSSFFMGIVHYGLPLPTNPLTGYICIFIGFFINMALLFFITIKVMKRFCRDREVIEKDE